MPSERDIEAAIARFRSAANLLEDARMAGAPPDCVAERERDLAAAQAALRDLGIDPAALAEPDESR